MHMQNEASFLVSLRKSEVLLVQGFPHSWRAAISFRCWTLCFVIVSAAPVVSPNPSAFWYVIHC